jgi:hypothetical protein
VTVRWLTAFLDRPAETFDAATGFWLEVTGSVLSPSRGEHGEFATLIPPDGDAFLRVQCVADGAGGCHLDLHVDNIAETAEHAIELGATRHQELDDVTVLRSPAGLAFCVVRHDGEATRPRPPAVSDNSTRTQVDQLCIDIGPDDYGRECAFWAALTRWEHRSALLSEFSYLARPDHVPLRLLFQRLHEAGAGRTASAHLDLACNDRDAAAARHRQLGARAGVRYEYWTTMTDPSGLPYCLTRRNPDTGLLDSPA